MVAAHLYTNITVQELAQLAGLSESSVKREFKKIYQHSPASYLRQQKLLRAENLLLSSGHNIRQVTHECGFKDIAHFSKLFKQTYGVSPSVYRAEHLVDS
jgi:AraC-like DNA-binding protein